MQTSRPLALSSSGYMFRKSKVTLLITVPLSGPGSQRPPGIASRAADLIRMCGRILSGAQLTVFGFVWCFPLSRFRFFQVGRSTLHHSREPVTPRHLPGDTNSGHTAKGGGCCDRPRPFSLEPASIWGQLCWSYVDIPSVVEFPFAGLASVSDS